MKRQPSLVKAVGLTTTITAAGYAVTLAQQVLYARALGVNAETDALGGALAWAVGTTGLVGTTLATVFLPRYVRANQAAQDADRLRSRATLIALVVGVALAAITFVAAPVLSAVLAPGGADDRRQIMTELLRFAAPLEVTWPLVWLAVSTANARERYVLAAASAILPPLPVIGLLVAGPTTVESVAVAFVGGTLLQLVALWIFEPHSRPMVRARGLSSETLGRDLVGVAVAFGMLSLVPLEVRGLASLHGVGDVAIADYASRLVLAGQQVLLSGLLAVTFTRWSRRTKDDGPTAVIDSVDRTIAWVGLAGAAVIALLPLLAIPVTRLVLVGGRFGDADAIAVGSFIGWMAPGVAGHMVLMVAARALLAEGRIVPVVAAGAVAGLAVLLVGSVGRSVWGLNGVAVGYSAGYLAAGVIGYVAVRRGSRRAGDRLAATRAFPIPSREASLLAIHEDVR